MSIRSTSPGGRYIISVDSFEAFNSQWVDTPTLSDAAGNVLLALRDDYWSMDLAEWRSESVVVMRFRHFPGDHLPRSFEVVADCEARTASLNGGEAGRLDQLEETLARAYAEGRNAYKASQ